MSIDNEARWYITEFKCDDNLENGVPTPCGAYPDLWEVRERIKQLMREHLMWDIGLLYGPFNRNDTDYIVDAILECMPQSVPLRNIKMVRLCHMDIDEPDDEDDNVFIGGRVRNYYWAVKKGSTPLPSDHLLTMIKNYGALR